MIFSSAIIFILVIFATLAKKPPYHNKGSYAISPFEHNKPFYLTPSTPTESTKLLSKVPAEYDIDSGLWVCSGNPEKPDMKPKMRSLAMQEEKTNMFSLSTAMVLDNNINASNYEDVIGQLTGISLYEQDTQTENPVSIVDSISALGVSMKGEKSFVHMRKEVFRSIKSEHGKAAPATRLWTGSRRRKLTSSNHAQPAFCQPDMVTVPTVNKTDPNVFTFPSCTRIERCGGCCSHSLLACQPTNIEMVKLTVTHTTYAGSAMKKVNSSVIELERHNACKCMCKIQEHHCNNRQMYLPNECRCACRDKSQEVECNSKPYYRFWDPDRCECKCKHVTECSTGLIFDHRTCSCSLMEYGTWQPVRPRNF